VVGQFGVAEDVVTGERGGFGGGGFKKQFVGVDLLQVGVFRGRLWGVGRTWVVQVTKL